MTDKTALLVGATLMVVAQALAWFQLNGQFIWRWCKDHPWLMIILPSVPISFFYLYATKYQVEGFQGEMWPSRFMSFGIGIIVFSILVWLLNNEPINTKTLVSIGIAVMLLSVQVLWK